MLIDFWLPTNSSPLFEQCISLSVRLFVDSYLCPFVHEKVCYVRVCVSVYDCLFLLCMDGPTARLVERLGAVDTNKGVILWSRVTRLRSDLRPGRQRPASLIMIDRCQRT